MQTTVIDSFLSLPRNAKRTILISTDLALLCFALWSAFSLRFGMFYVPESLTFFLLLLSAPVIAIICFRQNGLYKHVTRYFRRDNAPKVYYSMFLSIMVWCLLVFLVQGSFQGLPRSVIVIYGFSSILYILAIRSAASYILGQENLPAEMSEGAIKNVLIYGTGVEGIQLYSYLKHYKDYKLMGFIDDNKSLWRQTLYDTSVYSPASISELVSKHQIKEVFLTDPQMSSKAKQNLLNKLMPLNVQLKTLPTLKDLASGKVMITDFKQFNLEDLLNSREEELYPFEEENIENKSVMITGAGGTIGSELVRQIATKKPKNIILFERSELALYKIEHELQLLKNTIYTNADSNPETGSHTAPHQENSSPQDKPAFEIVTVLGSIADAKLVQKIIKENQVETLFHAAAYKLVPLIEDHPVAALENNIKGTHTLAATASELGVELFVYISTDKAHNPTHIMGASKNFSELHVNALSKQKQNKTRFAVVRFGNVLGSAGSVVELFSQQIKQGGPVTVTDPEMSRHFMTIREATSLIIKAGNMAERGEIYLLDKGQEIKIIDLAKSMISLSGNEITEDGDSRTGIVIEYIGLREGEEFADDVDKGLICKPTSNSLIKLCEEDDVSFVFVEEKYQELQTALSKRDPRAIQQILCDVVKNYKPRAQHGIQREPDKKKASS